MVSLYALKIVQPYWDWGNIKCLGLMCCQASVWLHMTFLCSSTLKTAIPLQPWRTIGCTARANYTGSKIVAARNGTNKPTNQQHKQTNDAQLTVYFSLVFDFVVLGEVVQPLETAVTRGRMPFVRKRTHAGCCLLTSQLRLNPRKQYQSKVVKGKKKTTHPNQNKNNINKKSAISSHYTPSSEWFPIRYRIITVKRCDLWPVTKIRYFSFSMESHLWVLATKKPMLVSWFIGYIRE